MPKRSRVSRMDGERNFSYRRRKIFIIPSEPVCKWRCRLDACRTDGRHVRARKSVLRSWKKDDEERDKIVVLWIDENLFWRIRDAFKILSNNSYVVDFFPILISIQQLFLSFLLCWNPRSWFLSRVVTLKIKRKFKDWIVLWLILIYWSICTRCDEKQGRSDS